MIILLKLCALWELALWERALWERAQPAKGSEAPGRIPEIFLIAAQTASLVSRRVAFSHPFAGGARSHKARSHKASSYKGLS